MSRAGSLEYAAFGGTKRFNEQGGLATRLSDSGFGTRIDRVATAWIAGGMLHWNTPIDGLAFRATVADAHGFEVDGSFPDLGVSSYTRVDDYLYTVLSAQYETNLLTLAAEYGRYHARGEGVIQPIDQTISVRDDQESGYISGTWHALKWLELYAAGECKWSDPTERGRNHAYTGVLAVHLMPVRHWSVKAEFRDVHGAYDLAPVDNPEGMRDHWQALLLKTTVDF